MNQPKLTERSIEIIMSGGVVDNPVMQVLGTKEIKGHQDKQRFRLLVSDGKNQISFAMLATQLNEKVISGELSNFTVIKIKKFITSMIKNSGQNDRRVIVILELEVVKSGSEVGGRIGNPVMLSEDHAAKSSTNGHGSGASSVASSVATVQSKAVERPPQQQQQQQFDLNNQLTFPISSLSPYQNKWVIKVRVTNKSQIRTWSNSRGEGKLFSCDLMDESGEIRATVFRDMVDKYYDMIEVDKVYYISKCIIKMANKQFSNLDNDYEITFCNDTVVQLCYDEVAVPKVHYNFSTIDNIANCEPNAIVDVIGVCQSASELVNLTSKTTNRELKKRSVNLVDQTNSAVELTLWGGEAESFDGASNPIVTVRGAKVGEFGGGKNLSVLMSSIMKINPDIPEAHRLRGWYDNAGKNGDMTNISARSAGGLQSQWLTFRQVKEQKLGNNERGDFYQCKATILLVNSNNCYYKACPTDDCNKKVVDMKNGMYRCEKCNREYPEFKYRLLMSMNLTDWTENQWVSTFTTEAEKILGKTSQEIGEAHEANEESLTAICNSVNFSEYIFRCRAKNEMFNDETRLKTVVMRIDPINYKEYHSYLLTQIKELVG